MNWNRLSTKPSWMGLLIRTLAMSSALALGVLLALDGSGVNAEEPVAGQTMMAYGKLPLSFEANRGQTDQQVKFLSRGSRHTLFLTSTEAVLAMTQAEQPARTIPHLDASVTQAVLRMSFPGANPRPRVIGREVLAAKVNYFTGNDPAKWQTEVPLYAEVQYQNLYSGIDFIVYGNQQHVEFDFIVAPGADPKAIQLNFEGPDRFEVDAQGDLVLHFGSGDIRLPKPVVYQTTNGIRQPISGNYLLTDAHRISFQVAAYDTSRPLVIDPTLFYSTYLGGGGGEGGDAIAIDAGGNTYVTGQTASTNFPVTTGIVQTVYAGNGDAFVTKLNATGSALIYSTFLGGTASDEADSITIDAAGNAYVTGATSSTNFPVTTGAFQRTYGGGQADAFVTKLNPSGSALVYSTFVGGSGTDEGTGIAVDAAGNVHATGSTGSANFPVTAGTAQPTYGGGDFDAYVTTLNPTGSGLIYSTYVGGASIDEGTGIAVDAAGNAYVTGVTGSGNFPVTAGAFQTTCDCGDAFVTKLTPVGSLVYSTYLGSGVVQQGLGQGPGIAVDTTDNAYVTGVTVSTTFPVTPGAFQTIYGGGPSDAFVAKLNPSGSALVYATYVGGSGDDGGFSIAVDAQGDTFVTGRTTSMNFPISAGAFQTAPGNGGSNYTAFVTTLNPTGSGLVFSTYLGGNGFDIGFGIAVDAFTNAYVTGRTASTNFPVTTGAFQTMYAGGVDAFVVKIAQVTLPSSSAGKVTGGGTIDVSGGIGNFSFIVQSQSASGPIAGHLQYKNHVTGDKVDSESFTFLTISGNTATFGGTCTDSGVPCTFTVSITDNGEPGKSDIFTISLNGGPIQGGTLRSGNVKIHQ